MSRPGELPVADCRAVGRQGLCSSPAPRGRQHDAGAQSTLETVKPACDRERLGEGRTGRLDCLLREGWSEVATDGRVHTQVLTSTQVYEVLRKENARQSEHSLNAKVLRWG